MAEVVGVFEAALPIVPHLLDHLFLLVEKIGDGLPNRIKEDALTPEFHVGKTDLQVDGSAHDFPFLAVEVQSLDITRSGLMPEFLQDTTVVQTAADFGH